MSRPLVALCAVLVVADTVGIFVYAALAGGWLWGLLFASAMAVAGWDWWQLRSVPGPARVAADRMILPALFLGMGLATTAVRHFAWCS
jgi:hypothetical protein